MRDPDLTLRSIAEESGLSRTYVSSLYKAATGQNVNEYLTALRIEKAKELLLRGTQENARGGPERRVSRRELFLRALQEARGEEPFRVQGIGVGTRRVISRRISDLGIRQKLFISYFMLVLFFLCLYLVINSVLVVNENKKQVLRSADHVFGQTRAYLQYKTESVRNLLYFLTSNSVVQELFERRALLPGEHRPLAHRFPGI